MADKAEKTIDEIFRDGASIDKALKQAVRKTLVRHKQSGNPVVVWRDGKAVWLKPEEITVE